MLRLGREQASCGLYQLGRPEQTNRTGISRNAYVFEETCDSKKVGLIAESDSESVEIDIWLGYCRRSQGASQQVDVSPLLFADFERGLFAEYFISVELNFDPPTVDPPA